MTPVLQHSRNDLYTPAYFIALAFNFLMGLVFTNNALYPLYVSSEGGDAGSIGWFMAAVSLSAILGRPLVGFLVDRHGVKQVLILGTLLFIIPPLGYYFLLGKGLVLSVWLLRLLQGFGLGAHFTAFFTMAAQVAPEGRRSEAVAMYGISGLASNLVGPFMGERLATGPGLPVFFLVMAGLGTLALILVMILPIQPIRTPGMALNFRKQFAALRRPRMRFALLLAAMLSISFSSAYSFIAPLAGERAITGFGLYFTGFAGMGITVRLFTSRWGDRFGWRRILIPGFLLYAAGLLTLSFSHSVMGMIVAGCLTGMAHSVSFPAVTSLGYTFAPADGKGSSMALVTGSMDAGSALSAALLGQVALYFGFGVIFNLAAVVPIAAAIMLTVQVMRNPQHLSRGG